MITSAEEYERKVSILYELDEIEREKETTSKRWNSLFKEVTAYNPDFDLESLSWVDL